MHAINHLVGVDAVKQACYQCIGRQANIHEDGFCPFIQAFNMLIEKWHTALYQSQPFPYAITQNETRVKHRHHGLRPRHECAIHRNQNIKIAWIDFNVVEIGLFLGHGVTIGKKHGLVKASVFCRFRISLISRKHLANFKS